MVSSGMSLLRALYVLEEQTENDKLREAFVEVRKDVEAGIALSASRSPATPTSSTSSTWRWWPRASPAASWRAPFSASPTSSRRTRAAAHDQVRRWSIRRVIGGFAVIVLLALVAFLVPVFEEVFKDFGGELPAITKFTVCDVAHRHARVGTC